MRYVSNIGCEFILIDYLLHFSLSAPYHPPNTHLTNMPPDLLRPGVPHGVLEATQSNPGGHENGHALHNLL